MPLTQTVEQGSVVATAGIDLVVEVCPACQCVHAIPRDLNERAKDDSAVSVYCPNGHKWVYARTLRERLADAEKDATRAELHGVHLQDQFEASERSRAATKGHLTRVKNRVAKGVCPCCKRTFKDLARHMHSKHPGYGGEKGDRRG